MSDEFYHFAGTMLEHLQAIRDKEGYEKVGVVWLRKHDAQIHYTRAGLALTSDFGLVYSDKAAFIKELKFYTGWNEQYIYPADIARIESSWLRLKIMDDMIASL